MTASELNIRSGIVVDAAMEVHSILGPGLLESAYQACLAYELRERGLNVKEQLPLPITYKRIRVKKAYRIDMLVDDALVVELKTVAGVQPVHESQLLSHLTLGDHRLGLLINFHVVHLKDGIKRMVYRL